MGKKKSKKTSKQIQFALLSMTFLEYWGHTYQIAWPGACFFRAGALLTAFQSRLSQRDSGVRAGRLACPALGVLLLVGASALCWVSVSA